MGFLVVVYAPDADTAKHVRDRMHNITDTGRVVGLYRLPKADQVTTCPGTCDATRKKLNGWGRHPVNGHLVHQCGRRHANWRSRISTALMDVLGINLLPRSKTPELLRNPEGWGK